NDISFTVCGNGFLYNMVRIIVGTLVKIGEGKIPPEAMKDIIDGKNRELAGKTMPAKGLTLKNAEYV
ncbi:MAG: tRNA pseudouridine(38-40) synthase TruA, partial [Candidatus Borkfalkiaceae bacterium]|nr:tRNA pseudouridine(38-40) synthase TruA [Christensenellaceae bacterium]